MKLTNIIATCGIAALFALGACKDTDVTYMQYIEQTKDSVFNVYPNVSSITIEVKNASILSISIVDKPLYNATDEKRQQRGNELGAMAMRIFPKDNTIDKCELHVAKDEAGMNANDYKNSDVDLQPLRNTHPAQ